MNHPAETGSPPRQAIVLVAGEGKRLRPFTDSHPKCFAEVRGRRILENTLRGLSAHGCTSVTIVVGHLADMVRTLISNRFLGMSVRYIENPQYRTTNSMYSLALGLEHQKEATWVLEGDVFFDHALLSLARPGGILWYVDSSLRHLDGSYVEASRDGRAVSVEIVRDLSLLRSGQSKSIGVLRLTREGVNKVRGWLRLGMEAQRSGDYYDLILRDHLAEGEVQAVDVAGCRWAEIDTPADLEVAERLFS